MFLVPLAPLENGPMRPPIEEPTKRKPDSVKSPPPEHLDIPGNKDANTWADLLLSKFPTFDPNWPDEVKLKWFDGFERLMKGRCL